MSILAYSVRLAIQRKFRRNFPLIVLNCVTLRVAVSFFLNKHIRGNQWLNKQSRTAAKLSFGPWVLVSCLVLVGRWFSSSLYFNI